MNPYLTSVKKIQFELSSTCNLLCLGCVRTDPINFNQKKEFIEHKQYLSKETFLKIISSKEFESATHLEFCGTIDDPLMHPEFLEMLQLAQQVKKFTVNIHSNASLRTPDYWIKLAETLLLHKSHQVNFSIDGLKDTNHIYRQGSNWDKIIKNASAFIQAGGYAVWQYLIFPWNADQIDEARALSKKMGFAEFHQRIDRSIATQLGLEKISQRKQSTEIIKSKYSSLNDIIMELEEKTNDSIECNNQKNEMYFVSYEGKLWPCCFIQNGLLSADAGKRKLLKVRTTYGDPAWNDCNIHPVSDILQHSFFAKDLVDSWKSNDYGSGSKHRIHRCTEVCSKKKIKELPIGQHKITEFVLEE